MKALSLKQPWATWIAQGRKTIETRTWRTNYRGPLLICASRRPCICPDLGGGCRKFPVGMALAVCRLAECRDMRRGDEIAARCQWAAGLYAWVLADVRAIEPFPVRGQLGLFEVEVPFSALSAISAVR